VLKIEKKHIETGEAWWGVRLSDAAPKVAPFGRGSRRGAA
jgi:hypothetical protein